MLNMYNAKLRIRTPTREIMTHTGGLIGLIYLRKSILIDISFHYAIRKQNYHVNKGLTRPAFISMTPDAIFKMALITKSFRCACKNVNRLPLEAQPE